MVDIATLGLAVDSRPVAAANANLQTFTGRARAAEHAANQLATRTGGMARGFAFAGGALRGLLAGVGLGIGAGGIGGLTAVVAHSIKAFEDFERQLFTTQAVIRATGGSAGRTMADIEALSREIGDITAVRAAATQLMTFRSIAENEFDRVLRAAEDLEAVGFGSLEGAALQLGKALEDPINGLAMLRRVGVSFSVAQRAVIKDLYETGLVAEAQRAILAQVEKQVGGAGARADSGLSGAYEQLGDATQRLNEAWGESITRGLNLTGVIRGIASAIDRVAEGSTPLGRLNNELARLRAIDSDSARTSVRGFLGMSGSGLESEIAAVQSRIGALAAGERYAAMAASAAAAAAREQEAGARFDSVVSGLAEEAAALRSTALAQAQYDAAKAAGVALDSDRGHQIATLVRQNYELSSAQDAAKRSAEEYGREAERQRDAIFGVINELQFEASTLGMSNVEMRIANELRAAGVGYAHDQAGAITALVKKIESWNAAQERLSQAQDDMRGFLSDLRGGLRDGEGAWGAFGNAAVTALDKIAERALGLASDNFISMLLGAFTGGFATGAPMNLLPAGFAKGAAFSAGNVIPFARGGIVNSPTIFPMSNGTGLMGEVGPEAVLPLRRGAGGRLGVENNGGGGSIFNFTIDARGAAPGVGEEIERHVRRAIDDNNRFEIPRLVARHKGQSMLETGAAA